MSLYIAALHAEKPGVVGVTFPDLPGCTSQGETLQHAAERAHEALALHLEGMAAEGLEIPKPRSLDEIDPAELAGGVAVLVRASGARGRAVRVNITLDEFLLADIDRLALDRKQKRSQLLAELAREAIAEAEAADALP